MFVFFFYEKTPPTNFTYVIFSFFFFFFNDTAPPEFYPLPLPDALPIPPLVEPREPAVAPTKHGRRDHWGVSAYSPPQSVSSARVAVSPVSANSCSVSVGGPCRY